MVIGTLTYSLTWTARILVRMCGIEMGVLFLNFWSEGMDVTRVQIKELWKGREMVSPQDAEVPFRVTHRFLAFIEDSSQVCLFAHRIYMDSIDVHSIMYSSSISQ